MTVLVLMGTMHIVRSVCVCVCVCANEADGFVAKHACENSSYGKQVAFFPTSAYNGSVIVMIIPDVLKSDPSPLFRQGAL